MKEYEKAVLEAIAKGPDYVGWYKIEQRLSNKTIGVRGYLPETLRRLAEQGLIEESESRPGTYRATRRTNSPSGS
jgi:DNA-binding PadR family transcriptional regulator